MYPSINESSPSSINQRPARQKLVEHALDEEEAEVYALWAGGEYLLGMCVFWKYRSPNRIYHRQWRSLPLHPWDENENWRKPSRAQLCGWGQRKGALIDACVSSPPHFQQCTVAGTKFFFILHFSPHFHSWFVCCSKFGRRKDALDLLNFQFSLPELIFQAFFYQFYDFEHNYKHGSSVDIVNSSFYHCYVLSTDVICVKCGEYLETYSTCEFFRFIRISELFRRRKQWLVMVE